MSNDIPLAIDIKPTFISGDSVRVVDLSDIGVEAMDAPPQVAPTVTLYPRQVAAKRPKDRWTWVMETWAFAVYKGQTFYQDLGTHEYRSDEPLYLCKYYRGCTDFAWPGGETGTLCQYHDEKQPASTMWHDAL